MKWHKYTYIHSERVAHFVVHKFIKEQIVMIMIHFGVDTKNKQKKIILLITDIGSSHK